MAKIIDIYDYIEVMPIDNNRFMIDKGEVQDEEELRDLNRKLIETATEIASEGYRTDESVNEILDNSEKKILSIVKNRKSSEFRTIKHVLMKTQSDLERLSPLNSSGNTELTSVSLSDFGNLITTIVVTSITETRHRTTKITTSSCTTMALAKYSLVKPSKKLSTANGLLSLQRLRKVV